VEINEDYEKYLNKELGFSKRKIKKAWNLAQKDFPRYNRFTIEVMTRDILKDRKSYEETKGSMKTGGRKK